MDKTLQRIRIAEFCGWLDVKYRYCIVTKQYTWLSGLNPKPYLLIKGIDAETEEEREPNEADYGWDTLPNYLYDLNAMQEAEKCLEGRMGEYVKVLSKVMTGVDEFIQWVAVVAPAYKRAEAVLKIVGLWEEEQ